MARDSDVLKAAIVVVALTILPLATSASAHISEGHGVQTPLPLYQIVIILGSAVGGFLIFAAKKMTTPPVIGDH